MCPMLPSPAPLCRIRRPTVTDPETGRITIYYGAADSYVGLAFAYADELVDYIKAHSVVRESDREIGKR